MIDQKRSNSSVVVIVTLFFVLSGLFQCFLPERVDLVGVGVGENNVKHVTIPVDGVPFDAFFDVLMVVSVYSLIYKSKVKQAWRGKGNSPQAARTSRPSCLSGTGSWSSRLVGRRRSFLSNHLSGALFR